MDKETVRAINRLILSASIAAGYLKRMGETRYSKPLVATLREVETRMQIYANHSKKEKV
jgi:hypothetical protein